MSSLLPVPAVVYYWHRTRLLLTNFLLVKPILGTGQAPCIINMLYPWVCTPPYPFTPTPYFQKFQKLKFASLSPFVSWPVSSCHAHDPPHLHVLNHGCKFQVLVLARWLPCLWCLGGRVCSVLAHLRHDVGPVKWDTKGGLRINDWAVKMGACSAQSTSPMMLAL